jgi:dTDP-4-dehydrorhamnose 3,5-epimerase
VRFETTPLEGLVLVVPEVRADARGSFTRTFCEREFADAGLPVRFVQCSLATNHGRGTLRGLHYQADPAPEGKLVRCTAGALFDVAVDLRRGSPTRLQWFSAVLSRENQRALFVPPGFAHGYQTLADETEAFYQMTAFYAPELARGLRWNDPALGIPWPIPDPVLSERDAAFPDYAE